MFNKLNTPAAASPDSNNTKSPARNFSLAACMSVNKERLEQLPVPAKAEPEKKSDKFKVKKYY